MSQLLVDGFNENSCVCVFVQLAEENPELPFHGVAFVDMGRLLYPGVNRIRGAYSILPFTEAELLTKVTFVHIYNLIL